MFFLLFCFYKPVFRCKHLRLEYLLELFSAWNVPFIQMLHNGTRPHTSADRKIHSGHWRCSTLFWAGPFSDSSLCMSADESGAWGKILYFGFQSEPSFQSEPVYYIPAPLPYVFWWLRERLHKQAKIERLGAWTCRRYLAFTDQTSSLCAVCLADGMWSLTWFTSPKLGIPAKGGKMEHLLDVWPNSGIKISAHL